MAPIVMYYSPASAPCRAVLMVAKELNITFDLREVRVSRKEHLTSDFLNINPQHCVPTIDDGGFCLWESRAIITYLVNKYSPGHYLYPNDARLRAAIDRLLYFDIGSLSTTQKAVTNVVLTNGCTRDLAAEKVYREKLQILDIFLEGKRYLVSANLTVADLSIFATLTFAETVDFDYSDFANISGWMNRLKDELPYNDEINDKAIKQYQGYFAAKRAGANVNPLAAQ